MKLTHITLVLHADCNQQRQNKKESATDVACRQAHPQGTAWQQASGGGVLSPVGRAEAGACSSDRDAGVGGQLQAELPVGPGGLQVASRVHRHVAEPGGSSRQVLPNIPAGSAVHAHCLEGAGIHLVLGIAIREWPSLSVGALSACSKHGSHHPQDGCLQPMDNRRLILQIPCLLCRSSWLLRSIWHTPTARDCQGRLAKG